MRPPDRLVAALAAGYTVHERIGEGGAATVWRATDTRHSRTVAIKVLKGDVAASLGIDRFLREIETIAGLQHPHVLPLFDSGAVEGLVYYVTPLIDGPSLRERIADQGPLPIQEALSLSEQIGAALTYAHGKGLVHRDIKPANVLLSSGRAVLADFGIATALAEAGGERLTATGVSIGTPEYMSPEQIEGSDVDPRADLYSLACVVFEMLTGEPPLTGRTAQSIFARRLTESPPSARVRRETVPDSVDRALTRAMSRHPVDRQASVDAFIADLGGASTSEAGPTRWRAVAGVAAVVGLIAGAMYVLPRFEITSPDTAPEAAFVAEGALSAFAGNADAIPLAVYPIENLMGDSGMQNVVDALHVDVITELQGIRALAVKNRPSTLAAAANTPDVVEFARALDARLVVTASVFRFGDTVTFQGQIVDGATGNIIKPIELPGTMDDIMGWKARFAQAVADSAGVEVSEEERERIASFPDVSRTAYESYARAVSRDPVSPDAIRANIEDLTAALATEPDFSAAWATLGAMHILSSHYGMASAPETVPLALAAADSALAHDPDHGLALSISAHVAYDYDFDWARADSLFQEALRKDPSDAAIVQVYGAYLLAVARYDEALAQMRTAYGLDPFFPFWSASIAWPLAASGREAAALTHLDTVPEGVRFSGMGVSMRRLALINLDRHEEVARLTDEGLLLPRGVSGESYALSGRPEVSRHIADSLTAVRASGVHVPAQNIARALIPLGEVDGALDWLWIAYEERESELAHIREHPVFGRLEGEPRYEALLDSLDFPEPPSQ